MKFATAAKPSQFYGLLILVFALFFQCLGVAPLAKAASFEELYLKSLENNFEIIGANLSERQSQLTYGATWRDLFLPSAGYINRLGRSVGEVEATGYGNFKINYQTTRTGVLTVTQNVFNESLRQNLKLARLAEKGNHVAAQAALQTYTFTFIQAYIQVMLAKYTFELFKSANEYYAQLIKKISEDTGTSADKKTLQLLSVQAEQLAFVGQLKKSEADIQTSLENLRLITGQSDLPLEAIGLLAPYVKDVTLLVWAKRIAAPDCSKEPQKCLYIKIPFDAESSLASAKANYAGLLAVELQKDQAATAFDMASRSWWPSLQLFATLTDQHMGKGTDPLTLHTIPPLAVGKREAGFMISVQGTMGYFSKKAAAKTGMKIAQNNYDLAVRGWKNSYEGIKALNELSLTNIDLALKSQEISLKLAPSSLKNFDPKQASLADLSAVIGIVKLLTPAILQEVAARTGYLTTRFNKRLAEGKLGKEDISYLSQFLIPWPAQDPQK